MIDFDSSLGKNKSGYWGELFRDCCERRGKMYRNIFSLVRETGDFETALRTGFRLYYQPRSLWDTAAPAQELKLFLQRLFEKYHPELIQPGTHYRIPPIIHQIWLGSELPERFKEAQKSWQAQGWQYILWTEKDIEELCLENKRLYDQSDNYGERSDIARYEILYRFGGIYCDCDFWCLQPAEFDRLNHFYDMYVGIQPLDIKMLAIANGLIASRPGHPVLRALIGSLKNISWSPHTPVWMRSGPVLFTKLFWKHAGITTKDIALPPTYFFPLGLSQKNFPRKRMHELIQPESMALHDWAASWQGATTLR